MIHKSERLCETATEPPRRFKQGLPFVSEVQPIREEAAPWGDLYVLWFVISLSWSPRELGNQHLRRCRICDLEDSGDLDPD